MNIQNIKAALAKQAQLLGVVPVSTTITAMALNNPATVTAASKTEKPPIAKTNATVSADAVTISGNTKHSLFDTITASPTVTPNISKIPSERQSPVTISSAVQTPTLPDDSVQPPVSLVHSNQLSLTSEPLLIPEEPKPARKAKKKVEQPFVIVAPKAEPIEVIVAKHLKAGRDYDRLPNTSKPTLFKSGAEILCGVFGFRTTTGVINRVIDFDKSFVMYEVQVTVYGADDKVVAEGIGSCNSKERKYLRGDFATQLNTILKMAKKKSLRRCNTDSVSRQQGFYTGRGRHCRWSLR